MFGLFCDDNEMCHELLTMFLQSKNIIIDNIERVERQKVIDLDFETKGIRLDIYVKDSKRVYNIEIQTGTTTNLAQRIRFYQAVMDIKLLPKGAGYNQLTETYIIFICTDSDPLKEGSVEYNINPHAYIPETGMYKKFDTKANWIIYNVSAYKKIKDNIKLKSFFAYLKGEPIENEHTARFDKHFKKVKLNEEQEYDFMITSLRDMEKLAEGIEQGIEQGKEEMILDMFGYCTIEQIALISKKTIEEVLEIQKQHNLGQEV